MGKDRSPIQGGIIPRNPGDGGFRHGESRVKIPNYFFLFLIRIYQVELIMVKLNKSFENTQLGIERGIELGFMFRFRLDLKGLA